MRVSVKLFAVLRERAGRDRIEIEIAGDSASLTELRAEIARCVPAIEPLLSRVRVAVNEEFASERDRVRAGDDVALIPPVSGGSGLGPFTIETAALDVERVIDAVRDPSAGAIVSFSGTVRDRTAGLEVVALEYEAYEPMAARYLRKIGEEIAAKFPLARVAIAHRIGRLVVGEVSVVIAVSSPHRADAFEACRYAIERLKEDVPIWKKEIRRDGSVWVGVGS
jgi:molybdopterin synthase catalytic subunit